MSEQIKIRLAKKIWDKSDSGKLSYYQSVLDKGVVVWNQWRMNEEPAPYLDLRGILFKQKILNGINLSGCNLSGAELIGARLNNSDLSFIYAPEINLLNSYIVNSNLSGSYFENCVADLVKFDYSDLKICKIGSSSLFMCDFEGCDLRKADFAGSRLASSTFCGAKIINTNFEAADLRAVDFSNTDIKDSNFKTSILVDCDFENSHLENLNVFGASIWRVKLKNTKQISLKASDSGTHQLTVDDLNVAQFLYTILNNPELKRLIDSISSKSVLIIGRFTKSHKRILDEIRNHLKTRDLIPIIFDFEKLDNRDLKETIMTLAHLAKYVIADITDPKSVPMELMAIVPNLPSVPIKPILLEGSEPWAMFESLSRYPWVLDIFYYKDVDHLLTNVDYEIIGSVEKYFNRALKSS